MSAIERILRGAGERALGYWRTGSLEWSDKATDGAVDLVTEADLAVDRLLAAELDALHPGVPILSEEGTWRPSEDGPSGDAFVLDPIDGTSNFAAGTHWWTIALARAQAGEIVEGWLYQPSRGTLWHARKGQGATRDGEPIRVATTPPRLGLVSVSLSRQMLPLLLQSSRFAGIRALGSHALTLAMVADGSLVLHAGGGHPWDVAGGHLFVEEAGGRVCTLDGGPRSPWRRVQTLAGSPASVDVALAIFDGDPGTLPTL